MRSVDNSTALQTPVVPPVDRLWALEQSLPRAVDSTDSTGGVTHALWSACDRYLQLAMETFGNSEVC